MLKYQLYDTGDTRLDGGLLCPACMRVHGRSADAILPLVTQWQTDGDERCLHAAEKLFAWSANMRRPDGSMNNDTNSNCNGITVFYANALGETLLWYGDKLPAADRDAWTARFAEMTNYLCQTLKESAAMSNSMETTPLPHSKRPSCRGTRGVILPFSIAISFEFRMPPIR